METNEQAVFPQAVPTDPLTDQEPEVDSAAPADQEPENKRLRMRNSGFGAQSMHGRRTFHTYDNLPDFTGNREVSCGHGAIAAIYDFYNVVPSNYGLSRNVPGNDGRMHYDWNLVNKVFQHYPPENYLNILRFTKRETIIKAMRRAGLKADEGYAGAGENGLAQLKFIKNWIAKHRLPVLCLMDMHDIYKFQGYTDQNNPYGWYSLHWGFIIGFNKNKVRFASWGQIIEFPMKAFMASWHCRGMWYPNNYYFILFWR